MKVSRDNKFLLRICIIVLICYTGTGNIYSGKINKMIKISGSITKENVAKLLSVNKHYAVSPEYVHLLKIEEFPGLIVVGEHITTHGSILRGIIVNGTFGKVEDLASQAFENAGWSRGDDKERIRLALIFVERVMYEFKGYVYASDSFKIFGKKLRPKFTIPKGVVLSDRGIEVTFWLKEVEKGKSANANFIQMKVKFSHKGEILENKILKSFSIGNMELHRSRPDSRR